MLILPIIGFGQEQINTQIKQVKVTRPEFTGIENVTQFINNGKMESIGDYLNKNIEYPEEAALCYKQGTAVVQFVVTADGEITGFNVINSVCPIIDKELIRVLKTTGGMWKPGFNNENPVDMPREVSMMFVADPTNKNAPKEYFTKLASNHFFKGNIEFLEKHNLRKALRNYNESIRYLPYDASSLLLRGLCKYELGDREGAVRDWERINEIGSYDADWCIEKLSYLPGYDEMLTILEE